jgi:Uma2 family endonuclease
MATATVTKLMTAEAFQDFVYRDENWGRSFELERGEVVVLPPPVEVHGVVCGNVSWILNNFVRRRKRGYIATNDTGVILDRAPDTVRGIDVSLYDEVRVFAKLARKYSERLPRLAVEVLSPEDRPGKVARRVMEFLQKGIPLVWIVDPEARKVTVYQRHKAPCVVEEDGIVTGNNIIPDLRCRVADFFEMPGKASPARMRRRGRK